MVRICRLWQTHRAHAQLEIIDWFFFLYTKLFALSLAEKRNRGKEEKSSDARTFEIIVESICCFYVALAREKSSNDN